MTNTPRPRRRRPVRPECVIGYLRVSTDEQAESGAGLDAQRDAIQAYADRVGIEIGQWVTDPGVSGGTHPDSREGWCEVITALADCEAGGVVVAKSDRLSRKTFDLLGVLRRAEAEGWTVTAADGSLDTSTPQGRFMVTALAGVAELERDLISERTKAALAARKRRGTRLGRPSKIPPDVLAIIWQRRADGDTLQAIADHLNDRGIPTARGGRWGTSSVQSALATAALNQLAASAGPAMHPAERTAS